MAAVLMHLLRASAGAALCASMISCGGGGGGLGPAPPAPTSNVASVVVDAGPDNSNVNTLFTSVTVCIPGTTTCQTIDHIQIDTASYGLRILAPVLTLALPMQTAADGNTLAECTVFADGYSWGPVEQADVQIAGESASALPIQVIGVAGFTSVPADCAASGPTSEDTVATFGANGILGIGVFIQDCGPMCASTAEPAFYYSCTSSACQATAVPLVSQVTNPIAEFADNNGSIIQLPSVASQGAVNVTGSLTFGIDTQSNNASGTQTVLTVDPNFGYLTAVFFGQSLTQSFIDSGSNANFFNDSNLLQCTGMNLTEFYCPPTAQSLTTTLQGANGTSVVVDFVVGNAQSMFTNNATFAAFPNLAGTYPGSETFDFGLPFYYGRRVAIALESMTTTVGAGPYIAF
jgi:hypothetical protein